ncbi:MAG: glycosyltransferase family 4 protein [Nitrospira sp.]
MKVVFINRFFYPDYSATSQLLTDLGLYLAKSGTAVFVVTGRQVYDDPTAALPAMATLQGVQIRRVWTSRFGRGRLWGRAIDYGTFYLSSLLCLLKLVRAGDVVVAKTDPPLISVIAAIATTLRGAVLINWIQDLFPEVASALSVKGTGWLDRPLRTLRNRSLIAARRNVVIGEGMAKKLQAEGIPAHSIQVIHNWSDGLAIQPVDRETNRLRHEWNLAGRFVVGYSGNFGRAHEFETILSAAELLRELPQIVFLFIGAGAQLASMRTHVETKQLQNVLFKPYQPRHQLSMSLSVPDLHVISLLPALDGLIVPSKFYGIAAAGRAMLYIGDGKGELPQVIGSAQCGFSVEIRQVQETADVISRLADDEVAYRRLGSQARLLFEQRFERSYAEKAWEGVISEATHKA